jgi:hypothetical protein
MASILGATVLTRRVAGWVHHRAPGPQPVSVAELHQTCDRLARSVEEPSLCSRELAALTRELQHLIRQVEQYAADTSARQGRMQELARAHSLIQEALQEVLTATPIGINITRHGLTPG